MVAKSYLHKVVKRLENPFAAVPFFVSENCSFANVEYRDYVFIMLKCSSLS